jgi:hypothetical protein
MSRENLLRILSEPQEPLFGRYIGTRRSCATIIFRVTDVSVILYLELLVGSNITVS